MNLQSNAGAGPNLCCLSVEQLWRRSLSGRNPFFRISNLHQAVTCIAVRCIADTCSAVTGNGGRVGLLSAIIELHVSPGSSDRDFSLLAVFLMFVIRRVFL